MKIEATKTVQIEAKTLKIHLKVSDRFSAQLTDQDGQTIHHQDDGYVPGFMPGQHHGDYVILDIDIDTGMVTNWMKPSAEQIQEWIKTEE